MHSQCQNGAIEISCDIAEFRSLVWTLEKVYKASEVRVEILTEADRTYDTITSARIPAPALTRRALFVFPLLYEFSSVTGVAARAPIQEMQLLPWILRLMCWLGFLRFVTVAVTFVAT
jgi:hypothetical protein